MRILLLSLVLVLAAGCSDSQQATPDESESPLDTIARRVTQLSLTMTPHDPAFVDAYFGPEALQEAARENPLSLVEIRAAAEDLIAGIDAESSPRARHLHRRVIALIARVDQLSGVPFTFNEETGLVYDAIAPSIPTSQFESVLQQIDALLPGDGPLADRVGAYRERFVIPPDRLAAVFDAAIAECRKRTLAQMELPANESFVVEYVSDKPWSGYNWYQGDSQSVIQVNTDLPIYIHRAVDLGCHEGYPGHHTYNALLEAGLVDNKGWIEFSLYPLFSPQSLIAEGSANHGIAMAFPDDERLEFEAAVLFPLAGLESEGIETYYQLLDLETQLDHVDNMAARAYLDGMLDRSAAEKMLVEYKLMAPERAHQRLDFIETYRGYVINYNLGRELVAAYVDQHAETMGGRWEAFKYVLSTPLTASDIQP